MEECRDISGKYVDNHGKGVSVVQTGCNVEITYDGTVVTAKMTGTSMTVHQTDWASATLDAGGNMKFTDGGYWMAQGATESDVGPIRGEYGFLSKLGGITEDEARARVRRLATDFHIREFEIYNAFEGYSRPPAAYENEWRCACLNTPVQRNILRAYADEITRIGGRSWMVVQAMGTDPDDVQLQASTKKTGQHSVNGEPLLDVVLPSAGWAKRIVPQWAEFASSLGFSGVHWATFGGNGTAGLPEFLRTAAPMLQQRSLAQTCNFIDGSGFDLSLVSDKVIAFTKWEVWSTPDKEDEFFRTLPKGSVFSCFPGQSDNHTGEHWNRNAKGIAPMDLMIARWSKAHCQGNYYLAVGDDGRFVRTDYYPKAQKMSPEDVTKVQHAVFDKTCPAAPQAGGGVEPPPPPPAPSSTTLPLPVAPVTADSAPAVAVEASGDAGVLGGPAPCAGATKRGQLHITLNSPEPMPQSKGVMENAIRGTFGFCSVVVEQVLDNAAGLPRLVVHFVGTCSSSPCPHVEACSGPCAERLGRALQGGLAGTVAGLTVVGSGELASDGLAGGGVRWITSGGRFKGPPEMSYQLRFVAVIWLVVPIGLLLGGYVFVRGLKERSVAEVALKESNSERKQELIPRPRAIISPPVSSYSR